MLKKKRKGIPLLGLLGEVFSALSSAVGLRFWKSHPCLAGTSRPSDTSCFFSISKEDCEQDWCVAFVPTPISTFQGIVHWVVASPGYGNAQKNTGILQRGLWGYVNRHEGSVWHAMEHTLEFIYRTSSSLSLWSTRTMHSPVSPSLISRSWKFAKSFSSDILTDAWSSTQDIAVTSLDFICKKNESMSIKLQYTR